MKILILSDDFPPLSFGGAGIAAYRLAKNLQTRGHEVSVFSTTQDKSRSGETSYDGLKIIFNFCDYNSRLSGWIGLHNSSMLRLLKGTLKEFGPDVVHGHNVHHYISYASLKLSKKYCDKIFLTAHDTNIFYPDKFHQYIDQDNLEIQSEFNYKLSILVKLKQIRKTLNPFRLIFIKYYLKQVDKIFAVSHSLKDALLQNGVKNIEAIYNGVTLDDENSSSIDFREKFKIARDKKIILVAGRFNTLKGGKLLLPYIEELKKTRHDFVLVFSGQKNNLAKEIISLAKNKGLGDYLLFTGWIEPLEMSSIYKASDVVITPSIYLDVFNLTNIEAMKHKKPVVGTCFGGTAEIVVDGVTGYIVNPLNIKDMSNKIHRLLSDEKLAKQFGQAGYQRVKEKFSLESLVDKTISYYKK